MWWRNWVKRSALASTVVLLLMVRAAAAFAQTDEIQVYDAEIADPGVLNLTVHNNFTPDGLKDASLPWRACTQWNAQRRSRVGLWGYGLVRAGALSAALQPFQQRRSGAQWI